METCTAMGVGVSLPAYPISVLRGCASIDEVDAFKDLPDGYIRVVMRLVKKIDVITPEKAIFARRDTLAKEAGKSCETVGRALRWLEDNGFINRFQVTRKFLKGSDSHIHPTRKMIEALGFGQRNTKASAAKEPSKSPQVSSDGSLSAVQIQNINIHKQSTEPVDNSPSSEPPVTQKLTVKIQGKSLPADLAWMVKDGKLQAIAVLRLMVLAKQTGKLLSDVVAVAHEYLVKLKGNALFGYVRTLIQQDKDFKYIRQQQAIATGKEKETQFEKDLIARKAQEWVGRRFTDVRGGQTYLVEKDGWLALVNGTKFLGSRIFDKHFVHAVEDGRIVFCNNG